MPKIRKDVLIMDFKKYFPDEFEMIGKQMSRHVAVMNAAIRRVGTSSDKSSDGFQSFLNAVDAAKELERFKDLTETELHGGNKRNGTQDRRQSVWWFVLSNEWKEILKSKLKSNAEFHEAEINMKNNCRKLNRQLNKARKDLSL